MPIYAKFPTIEGDVTETNHKKWIELTHVNLGVERSTSMQVGKETDRISGFPQFSAITLHKKSDSATAELFQAICRSQVFNQVDIEICSQDNAGKILTKYQLSNVLITAHQHFGNGSKSTEELTLNYAKIVISSNGSTAGYDLEKATIM